jgi:DNA-binding GntR family transcriptional regulator
VTALVPWLATRIVEHLHAEGTQPGDHIAEQRLADAFKVSRTPVRQALALLANSNAVEQRPNRGYFLAQATAEVSAADVAAAGDDDDPLYYRIAEDRLAGKLDERVTEMALVRKYRTTRPRIRALLHRMAQEGWTQRLPGHGWAFLPAIASTQGYAQAFRFRAVIEPAALREPGYSLAPDVIERCRRRQRELLEGGLGHLSDAEVFQIGAEFHEAIVGGSGNAFFIDAMRRINALRRLMEYRAKRSHAQVVRQCTEHLELLDLIGKGRMAAASRFLEKHLTKALEAKSPLVKPGKR